MVLFDEILILSHQWTQCLTLEPSGLRTRFDQRTQLVTNGHNALLHLYLPGWGLLLNLGGVVLC